MKSKFKSMLSIFLILCLVLTMMPGMALSAQAYEEEIYSYELRYTFNNHCEDLLPIGQSTYVYTELIANGYNGDFYYHDYSITAELESNGSNSYSVDELANIEVIGSDTVKITSNDEGKMGGLILKVKAYVDGEEVAEFERNVYVTTEAYHWPQYISDIDGIDTDCPYVGTVVDFSNIVVGKQSYDIETGNVHYEEVTLDSSKYEFREEYSSDDWAYEDNPYVVTRISPNETELSFQLWGYRDDEGQNAYYAGGVRYQISGLNYDIYWEDHDWKCVFTDQEETSFLLNTDNLEDKGECDVNIELGYEVEGEEGWEFVPFDEELELYSYAMNDNDDMVLTLKPSAIKEFYDSIGIDAEENGISVHVNVSANGYWVSGFGDSIGLREPFERYEFVEYDKLVLYHGRGIDAYIQYEVENAQHPDGHYVDLPIVDIELISGEGVITEPTITEGRIRYDSLKLGKAEVEVTYEDINGDLAKRSFVVEVVEKIYNIYFEYTPESGFVLPGTSAQINYHVESESYEGSEYNPDIYIEWGIKEMDMDEHISIEVDENDPYIVMVSADATTPVDREFTIYAKGYEVDEDGNVVTDEEGNKIQVLYDEYGMYSTNHRDIVIVDGFDFNLEIGDSCTVTPMIKRVYINEDGEYVEEYVDGKNWNIYTYDSEAAELVNNGDGTYTITRFSPYYINIEWFVYDEYGETGTNYYSLRTLEYWTEFDELDSFIVNGDEGTFVLNTDYLEQRKSVSIEWGVGWYSEGEFVSLDEGYTVSEDMYSIVVDGTYMYEIGVTPLVVKAMIYAGEGEHRTLAWEAETFVDIYDEGEAPEVGDPDIFDTAEDFLALADENGVISLDNAVMICEALVIDDGKNYTIEMNSKEIYFPFEDEVSIEIINGTLNINNVSQNEGERYGGFISGECENTVVINGPKDVAVLNVSDNVYIYGYESAITVKSGTLNSGATLYGFDRETEMYTNGLIVEDDAKSDITLTSGHYYENVSKYLPSTHTMTIWCEYLDENQESLQFVYSVIPKPLDDEDAVENWLLVKDTNGYYYGDEETPELLGVEYERIGYSVDIAFADENGEFNDDSYVWFPAMTGLSIREAYKLATGEDFPENDNVKWYALGNWEEDLAFGDVIFDENGDFVFDENGNPLFAPHKIINYGDNEIDIDSVITDDIFIAAKWVESEPGGGDEPVVIPELGDVNGDGEVDTVDASTIISYYYGKVEFSETQVYLADVNGDGEVDTVDASTIISYYYGKIESFS